MLSNGLCTEVFAAGTWFVRLLKVNVLRSEHLIHGVFRKNKGVTFHSWGRRLISESLASEVQAVKLIYISSIIARFCRHNKLFRPGQC